MFLPYTSIVLIAVEPFALDYGFLLCAGQPNDLTLFLLLLFFF